MPSVVLAKMDADAHTPPEDFKFESYPTILFLKVRAASVSLARSAPATRLGHVLFSRYVSANLHDMYV